MYNNNGFVKNIKLIFMKIKDLIFKSNKKEFLLTSGANKTQEVKKSEFKESYIFEEKYNIIEKKDFIKQMEENPELLDKLSIERLEKLDSYYDELIEKNNLEIKKLEESTE